MKFKAIIASLLGTLALAGCSGQQALGGSQDVQVVQADALPAPGARDVAEVARAYLIGPFDKLKIDVFGLPDLAQRITQVDSSGQLSFPLVGTLTAAGKTPTEVARMIEDGLRAKYIRDPQVTVNLEETVSQVVAIDGEVREPGLYPVVGRLTLMRAVATAKGLSEYADKKDVVVFRTVNGQKMAALYNLNAIRRGTYPDPEIFANDVVVVGDSPGRRLFKDIVAASALITTPLIILLR